MLKQRSNEPELMDDLTLSGEDLRRNLDELEVINHWLGGHKVVLDALDKLVAQHKNGPLRIADIGCGGGDTLKNIARWAKKCICRTYRCRRQRFYGAVCPPPLLRF